MWPARRDVWFSSTAASITNILCQDIYYLKKTGIKLTIIGKMRQKLKLCKSDCEGESSVAIIWIVVVTDGTGSGWGNDTSLKRCKSPRNATIETYWPRNRSIFRCRLNSGLAFLYPPGDVEYVYTDQSLPTGRQLPKIEVSVKFSHACRKLWRRVSCASWVRDLGENKDRLRGPAFDQPATRFDFPIRKTDKIIITLKPSYNRIERWWLHIYDLIIFPVPCYNPGFTRDHAAKRTRNPGWFFFN